MALPSLTSLREHFDIDVGVLCLDFANTADWHASAQPVEMLPSYTDLVGWCAAAGLLSMAQAEALIEAASARPDEAQSWLEQAIRLREAIYRIFSRGANGDAVDGADVDILSGFRRQAAQYLRLVKAPEGEESHGYQWEWDLHPQDLGRMLWPIARSAVDLLMSPDRRRVGQCQDDRGCGWLFMDTSKNHTRRWCSMESCGNRAKAMRHYHKGKDGLDQP
jgi:predicted RNA-binding Zn ribbon-like protein